MNNTVQHCSCYSNHFKAVAEASTVPACPNPHVFVNEEGQAGERKKEKHTHTHTGHWLPAHSLRKQHMRRGQTCCQTGAEVTRLPVTLAKLSALNTTH